MTWLLLFFYLTGAFGFAFIVGHSLISLPLREWLATPAPAVGWSGFRRPSLICRWTLALLECPACLGFHIGWISSLVVPSPEGVPLYLWTPALALSTCATNFILGRLTGLITTTQE